MRRLGPPSPDNGLRPSGSYGGLWIFLAVAILSGPARASEFISTDEIHAGMAGYGLTVFQGTEPETFALEAVGVLKNRFPKQDLVIIHMTDPKLQESNGAAGMSGSPIYFGGRLLGALAYGPIFSKKPIAYVTPIQNMLRELDRPSEPRRPWQRMARLEDVMSGVGAAASGPASIHAGSVVPAASTLAVSGFSTKRFKLLEQIFSPMGLVPVASGGADATLGDGPTAYVPGAALGVQLMTGDLALTAIGTVTYVDPKGRVLAFGHPFFNIGQTAMPAATAYVHMILPNVYTSYKVSSPIRTMGSMVQDRQPAVLIDPNRTAPMVPVAVRVENLRTGHEETYRYRVIREQMLTPLLTFLGLAESIDVAEASPTGDRAFSIRSRIGLSGLAKPADLTDVTPSPYKTFFDILMLLENPIEEAVPTLFEFDVKVMNVSKLAWITEAKVSRRKFRPGERVPIRVRLRNQNSEEFEHRVEFPVPASFSGRFADFEIRGGFGFAQPEPQPRTLEQLVRQMENRPKGSDLLVRLMQATPSFSQNGAVLPDLPIFFQRLVIGGVQGMPQAIVQQPYEKFPTDLLILGSQRVQIEIEPEGRP